MFKIPQTYPFVQIADWVADSILCKEEARRRAQVIKHLILIADVRHFLLMTAAVAYRVCM